MKHARNVRTILLAVLFLSAIACVPLGCADQKAVTATQKQSEAATQHASQAQADLDAARAALNASHEGSPEFAALQVQVAQLQSQLSVAQSQVVSAQANASEAAAKYNANTQRHLDELNTGSGFAGMIPGYGTIAMGILGAVAAAYTRYRGIATGVVQAGSAVAIGQGNMSQTPAGDPAVTFNNAALVELLHKAGAPPALINALTV
jgi:hypothetical protein